MIFVISISGFILPYSLVYAQHTQNNTTESQNELIEFLSIQNAKLGSISEINSTAYILELKDISQNYFILRQTVQNY